MLVLCMVSVFRRFVVQRVLLWSVCRVGSLYGHAVPFIGLWCRESCYGQCVMLVLCMVSVFHRFVVQRVLLWSVYRVVIMQCIMLVRLSVSFICLWSESPVVVIVILVVVSVSCRGHALCHVGSLVSVLHRFVVSESPVVVSVSCCSYRVSGCWLSPVVVSVSCRGHVVCHVGSLVNVLHLFVVRECCRA